MAAEETVKAANVQFAVTLVRMTDGSINVAAVPELPEAPNLDAIYETICTMKRNIESQQTTGMIVQLLTQLGAQQAAADPGVQRTESGIVLP